jgi:hypothetical protein
MFVQGLMNDLWKFDGETWVWVLGSDQKNQSGIYGEKGIPHFDNIPGARGYSVSWVDNFGKILWLFGGTGFDYSGNYGIVT